MVTYYELSDLDDAYLICKARTRHKMDLNPSPQELGGWRAQAATYVIPWRCERCGRECYEFLDSQGRRIGTPYYTNPVDYPHTHRIHGDEVRAEMIRRNVFVKRLVNGVIQDNGSGRRPRKSRRT